MAFNTLPVGFAPFRYYHDDVVEKTVAPGLFTVLDASGLPQRADLPPLVVCGCTVFVDRVAEAWVEMVLSALFLYASGETVC